MTSIKVQTFEIIKRLKTAGAAWYDFRLYCVLNQSISELCCTSKEILLIYKICKNFYICGQIINFNIRILFSIHFNYFNSSHPVRHLVSKSSSRSIFWREIYLPPNSDGLNLCNFCNICNKMHVKWNKLNYMVTTIFND